MKKKLLSFVIMCMMAVSVLFVGCSPKGLSENPPTDANVISNGGMSVIKGDYLYFVNGYVDETGLTEYDNKSGKVVHAGIYRTKLSNGKIEKDKDGFLTNCDQVVSKVVGFSNGGFFIMDDYIYYATPVVDLNSTGTVQNSLVEFHRININGTKDQTLYTTEKSEDVLDWTLYKIDNVVYIATYVDSKIVIINTNNTKDIKYIENTTSYAFLHEEDYQTNGSRTSELQNYIYYTRAITSSDANYSGNIKGNIVGKVNIATGEKIESTADSTYTYSIVEVKNDEIYYTKTNSLISGLSLLYCKDVNGKNWDNTDAGLQLSYNEYSNYYVCDFGMHLVIADDSNGTYLLENGSITKIATSQRTVIGMSGDMAYYANNGVLYAFNVRGEVVGGDIASTQVTTTGMVHLIDNYKYLDFDGQRVYVYGEYTASNGDTNYYLNYIDADGERFVGTFEESHTPEQPEQEEGYGEDEDVEYTPWID